MVVKITNRERLRRKLRALPEAVKREIRPAMEKGAQEIADFAYKLAPEDQGELRNSIDWTWGIAPVGFADHLAQQQAQGRDDLLITVYAGNELAYYARWVEFGTKGSPDHKATAAQPFFFPAYRGLRKRVKNRIALATQKAVRKVASFGRD